MKQPNFKPGTKMYSVAIGLFPNIIEMATNSGKAKQIIDLYNDLDGIAGVHPVAEKNAQLFMFNSRQDAIKAKNVCKHRGIPVGNNICEFTVAKDGVPEFTETENGAMYDERRHQEKGIYSEDCGEFITADESASGKYRCPNCGRVVVW